MGELSKMTLLIQIPPKAQLYLPASLEEVFSPNRINGLKE